MNDNIEPGFERHEGEGGKQFLKIRKIPLEDLLNILENLYEAGTNFIDMDFFIDPKEEQSVITITTRPEYMASQEELNEENKMFDEYEEDDEDEDEDLEDDDILSKIKKENEQPDSDPLSDDEIDELL